MPRPDFEPSDFGAWLRETRVRAGLSQEDLARTSGLSSVQISNIERGKTQTPKPSTRRRIQAALGATPHKSRMAANDDSHEDLIAWRKAAEELEVIAHTETTRDQFLKAFGDLCSRLNREGLLTESTVFRIKTLRDPWC